MKTGTILVHQAVVLSLIWAHVFVHWHRPAWIENWNLYYRPVVVVVSALSAAMLISSSYRFVGVLHAVYAAVFAWMWWDDNQKRRKKLRDRLAARVKNLGHRLVVVHPAGQ